MTDAPPDPLGERAWHDATPGGGALSAGSAVSGEDRRTGFATLVGRPNVGKSTLLNQLLGQKVSITSPVAQTTRNQVRGVLTRPDAQVVFVDTPGIHKPRTLLGQRLNDTASDAIEGVDVTILVLDATAPVGRGDRFVADLVPPTALCVVNKVDVATKQEVIAQLVAASRLDLAEYFPVSARTGEGTADLVEGIVRRLPVGPLLYPDDMVTDVPEAFWVAELVREQLLAVTREEVPHSIACRVTEWEWPRVRCEILVERDSQKGIVIGKGGAVLKEVGMRVREQLPPGAFVELFVKVDANWQARPKALERLGY
jgi:GTP-binding protein Era